MILKIKHFVVFITVVCLLSCAGEVYKLSEIEAKQIVVDSSLPVADSINAFVTPYRKRVREILDSTLAYAPNDITKTDGKYNTTAGNLLADIVLQEASPIFKLRIGKEIDFVLLNHGGIRSVISKGHVTTRTAYEVMPFENTIVVAELSGASVIELVSFLRDSGRAHPIAGIQIALRKDNSIGSILIRGKPLKEDQTYYVATSNYLVNGGDHMGFFSKARNVFETDYLIRNAMIDYFKMVDTVRPVVDKRFFKGE